MSLNRWVKLPWLRRSFPRLLLQSKVVKNSQTHKYWFLSGCLATWIAFENGDNARRSVAAFCEGGELTEQDLATIRGVVGMHQAKTGLEPESFILRGRAIFSAVAGPNGTMTLEQLDKTVRARVARKDEQQFIKSLRDAVLDETGPLLFRLLDADHTGRLTLKEFLLGQALLYAAKEGAPVELSELCWRLLDVHGKGVVERHQLKEVVRVMTVFGAINHGDRCPRTGEFRMTTFTGDGRPRIREKRHRRSLDELVELYMDRYDASHTGHITRTGFFMLPYLRENLRLLLSDSEARFLFMLHEDTM